MTELAELVERLEGWAAAIDNDGTPSQVGPSSQDLRAVAAAIERLERERADWEAACDGNTALGAEIAETLKAALEAAEYRALTAEAELEKVREALRVAEVTIAEAAIPLEAIVATGKGANSQAVWDGACNAVVNIRLYMEGRAAARAVSQEAQP